jgi:hypothetical protein
MTRIAMLAVLTVMLASSAGCGSDGGGGDRSDLRSKVEKRFAAEGVTLNETGGFYEGGPDLGLAPQTRAKFGDFVVHIEKDASGFAANEQSTSAPDANGIRWDDALATHHPPYYTSYKRYGDALELQWSSEQRSIDDPHWRALDAIMRELQTG